MKYVGKSNFYKFLQILKEYIYIPSEKFTLTIVLKKRW